MPDMPVSSQWMWREERREVQQAEKSGETSTLFDKRVLSLIKRSSFFHESSHQSEIETVFRDLARAVDSVVNGQQNQFTDIHIRELLGEKLVESHQILLDAKEELSKLGIKDLYIGRSIKQFIGEHLKYLDDLNKPDAIPDLISKPDAIPAVLEKIKAYRRLSDDNKKFVEDIFYSVAMTVDKAVVKGINVQKALLQRFDALSKTLAEDDYLHALPTPENAHIIPDVMKKLGDLGVPGHGKEMIDEFIHNYHTIVANRLITREGVENYNDYAKTLSRVQKEGLSLSTQGVTPGDELKEAPSGPDTLRTPPGNRTTKSVVHKGIIRTIK